MLNEFKAFALKGNLVDMAVGLTLGAAFGALAGSFVADVFSPPLGLLLGGADFSNLFLVLRDGATVAGPYASVAAAREAGAVTVSYGVFINAAINFLIVALAMFMVVKGMNNLKKKEAAAPAPPPAPSAEEKLLTEIRDLLKR
jgi:large conductance mechanosensitive channel